MSERYHRGFSAAEKTELWDRWQRGESLKAIGRAFGKPSSSIYFQLAPHGGIRPAPRRPCTSVQESTMQDKRRVQRTSVLKDAKIILNNHSSLFDCTVINLTNLGSCVNVPSSAGIPNSFALSFDRACSSRRCRVIWRTENRLGVSFG